MTSVLKGFLTIKYSIRKSSEVPIKYKFGKTIISITFRVVILRGNLVLSEQSKL